MTGLDGISAEVWKLECFNEVCNRAYHGDTPCMWLKGAILPFPKKGDLGSASKYRYHPDGTGGKIYIKMLLNRHRPHINSKLRNNLNGFRKGRSPVSQILSLRILADFGDFRKAFDSIHKGGGGGVWKY